MLVQPAQVFHEITFICAHSSSGVKYNTCQSQFCHHWLTKQSNEYSTVHLKQDQPEPLTNRGHLLEKLNEGCSFDFFHYSSFACYRVLRSEDLEVDQMSSGA